MEWAIRCGGGTGIIDVIMDSVTSPQTRLVPPGSPGESGAPPPDTKDAADAASAVGQDAGESGQSPAVPGENPLESEPPSPAGVTWRRRPVLLALGAALLLGGWLRVADLSHPSLWEDEMVVIADHFAQPWPASWNEPVDRRTLAARPRAASWGEYYRNVRRNEDSPFAYFAAIRGWSGLFGMSEAGLRPFSALCGLGALLLFAGLAVRLLPAWPAVAAVLLFAVHPCVLELSREARPYSLLLLLAAASLLLLLRIAEGHDRPAHRVLFVVVTALLLYTHHFALGLVAAEALALVWIWKQPRALPWFGLAGVLYLPGAWEFARRIYFVGSGARTLHVTVGKQSRPAARCVQDLLNLPAQLVSGNLLQGDAAAGILLVCGLGLLALVLLWAGLRAWLRRDRRQTLTLALLLAVPYAATLAGDAVLGLDTIRVPRYLLFLALPYLLLLAQGLEAVRPRVAGGAVLALLVPLVAGTAWFFTHSRNDFDWRHQVREIEAATTRSDLILLNYERDAWLVGWHLQTPRRLVVTPRRLPAASIAALPAGARLVCVWRSGQNRWAPAAEGLPPPLHRLVRRGWLVLERQTIVSTGYRSVFYFRRPSRTASPLRTGPL